MIYRKLAFIFIVSYLIGSLSFAIIISKVFYKKDIRTCGSKNPGFTNFKRTFGNKWAWFVLALDMSKAAIVVVLLAMVKGKGGGRYSR